MKRIEYNNEEVLRKDYLQIFDGSLSKMQKKWGLIRKKKDELLLFPKKIEDILLAKFENLAQMYSDYKKIDISDEDNKEIRKIFRYNGYWQNIISKYFRVHSEEMGINTCCYCETAYINTYQKGNRQDSHFDLDHFFPKYNCPILALSFYNFVPSCPICNERMKRNDILGEGLNEWLLLSPTSDQYVFDELVKIHVLPKQEAYHCLRYQDNMDKFTIHFETASAEYKKEIDMFHLNERYEFHKCEALRLLDLKQDYPDTHIMMISNTLKRDKDSIKEDIFHKEFITSNHRTFSKLYIDIFISVPLKLGRFKY